MQDGNGNQARKQLLILPDSVDELPFCKMMVDGAVAMLSHQLSAIRKWEDVAWQEVEAFEAEMRARYPDGFPDPYDPLVDEAFIRHHTGLALYGSLAVAISAKVEDLFAYFLSSRGLEVKRDGRPRKDAVKPSLADCAFTLEQVCGCSRDEIEHYHDHLFVRELANRFKHSGGNGTREFVTEWGSRAGVEEEGESIPFTQYDWKSMIEQTGELLADLARRLDAQAHNSHGAGL